MAIGDGFIGLYNVDKECIGRQGVTGILRQVLYHRESEESLPPCALNLKLQSYLGLRIMRLSPITKVDTTHVLQEAIGTEG